MTKNCAREQKDRHRHRLHRNVARHTLRSRKNSIDLFLVAQQKCVDYFLGICWDFLACAFATLRPRAVGVLPAVECTEPGPDRSADSLVQTPVVRPREDW